MLWIGPVGFHGSSPGVLIDGLLSKGARGEVAESAPFPGDARRLLRERRHRHAMELPDELQSLLRFHGHLGVYGTLGLRMGAVGTRRFGYYKGLRAVVASRPAPPMP